MKKLILLLSIMLLSNSKVIGYCDIKGSVKSPGVYEIKEKSTINDIIKLAGGLTKNADTNNINLSKKVTDEMVIYIFNKDELKKKECICKNEYIYKCDKVPINTTKTTTTTTKTSTTTTTTKVVENKKININIATLEDLTTLNGIGTAKAKKIIEYREQNGLFKTIEDLLNVSGIGENLFEQIKDFIEV